MCVSVCMFGFIEMITKTLITITKGYFQQKRLKELNSVKKERKRFLEKDFQMTENLPLSPLFNFI